MKQQWPSLSYQKGKPTYDTLHMWTQILGKIKLVQLPWKNHSWHVTYKEAKILPAEAYYHSNLREFVLPYKVVQESDGPGEKLREFLDNTYRAGAALAHWDREALE